MRNFRRRSLSAALGAVSLMALAVASGDVRAQQGMFGTATGQLSQSLATVGNATPTVNAPPRNESLTAADVTGVIQRVVAEALERDALATVAVTDRVGNVLAVYQMTGAADAVIDSGVQNIPGSGIATGFEGIGLNPALPLPAELAAIAKSVTGSYLSSNGNAFSTRTASAIVQQNFLPGSENLEGGPLFGVQISSLPCSDLSVRRASNNGGTISPTVGPKRSPLGLAADPGGLPLYKNGTAVGAVGVLADGIYGADLNVRDRDRNVDELLALAGTRTLQAPTGITAERITVDGRVLRFSDARVGDLATTPASGNAIDLNANGAFIEVPGYKVGIAPEDGQAFGFGASGYLPDREGIYRDNTFVLTIEDGAGGFRNRFPPTAGSALTADEVRNLIDQAIGVAMSLRAQIRIPFNSSVEVTVSVVDVDGTILGVARTPDGPIFGTDVSLQKARGAAFFSNPGTRNFLLTDPIATTPNLNQGFDFSGPGVALSSYVGIVDTFISNPPGFVAFDGSVAFSSRSVGNLARPFFPDGSNGNQNGPLSLPIQAQFSPNYPIQGIWSPFYTGFQVDSVFNQVATHLIFVNSGGVEPDAATGCLIPGSPTLGGGTQIFSGGVPLYRDGVFVGAIGVSGDGIDQDDTVAFLGASRAGRLLDTGLDNAPKQIRSDGLRPDNVTLRYVQCPYTPFLGSNRQNICQGL